MVLKALVVGRGPQNYTCTGAPTSPPVAAGATAVLLDAKPAGSLVPTSYMDVFLANIPTYALRWTREQLEQSGLPKGGH